LEVKVSLYHVSIEVYKAGLKVVPVGPTHFIARRDSDPGHKRLELAFDSGCTNKAVSRKTALFAFESLAQCRKFWDAEQAVGARPEEYGEAHYYEVSMPVPTIRAPMPLVDHVMKLIRLDLPTVSVIQEYWAPTQQWNVWEHLGPVMVIKNEVSAPSALEAGACMYPHSQDIALANKLWPLT
jgi:hypothetical protein